MRPRTIAAVVLLGALAPSLAASEPAPALPARLRQPVALALDPDTSRLFVANRLSGTITALDLADLAVVSEGEPAGRLTDLARTPDGRLLAADEAGNRLVVFERRGEAVVETASLPLPATPASVELAPGGGLAAVASSWARAVSVVDLGPGGPRVARSIALPFAPRRLEWLGPEGRLVVADACGSRLAVLDPATGAILSSRTLPAHNIAGLIRSADGRELRMVHQILNRHARTTADDLHWGSLLNNSLRRVPVADLLDPSRDLVPASRLAHFDEFGAGAGDPSALVELPDGRVAVALAGVGEVAIGTASRPADRRVRVGRRPTALALDRSGTALFVADASADAIVRVDLVKGEVAARASLGPAPEPGPVERGERLFHDARLAHEGWLSCQSCHTDGHTNGLLADTLGDGTFGEPKRVHSLLGVADTAPFAWNGEVADLETQVARSIRTTMRGAEPTPEQVADLAAYLRSLPAPPATVVDQDAVARGRVVFRSRRCDQCHRPPAYTTRVAVDVWDGDGPAAAGFNPPSLRGVGHRTAFFHDGRARSLVEVFGRFAHPEGQPFADGERDDLIAFLQSL